ncbi:MAG: PKD domain-containing protein [Thermoplasmatota archaeon]
MRTKGKVLILSISVLVVILLILLPSLYLVFRYSKPETTVRSLHLIDIDQGSRTFRLGLTLQVYNPNNLKLRVYRIEGDIFIDDEELSPLYNLTGASVPPKGSSEIELVMIVDDSSMKVLTGDELRIKGRSYGKYLWTEGSSEFEEVMDLPGSGNGVENLPPVSVIEAPLTGVVFEEVEFDGSLSTDPDGYITVHHWDLGDGTTEEGEFVTHRYEMPGLYLVRLTTTDDDGSQDTARHEITIRVRP